MDSAEIARRLQEKFRSRILDVCGLHTQRNVQVAPEALVEAVLFLKDHPDLAMDMLVDMVGVDYLGHPHPPGPGGQRFAVLLHFLSLKHQHRFTLVVATDEGEELPSLWRIYHAANWLERELFDMFGLRFSGHPNLRRILCHHEFEGHALRKDYPIQRRQRLTSPEEIILTDDPEWA